MKLQVFELRKRQMCGRQLAIGRTPQRKKSSLSGVSALTQHGFELPRGAITLQVRGLI